MNKQTSQSSHHWWRICLIVMAVAASLWLVMAVWQTANSAALTAPKTQATLTDCVDFADLTVGTQYHVDDIFVDSGAVIIARPFVWSNGTVYTGGVATVVNDTNAGGTSPELAVNNINLAFNFGQPLSGLSFLFGEYGGNLNLEVNGVFTNFQNFAELNGQEIGGVTAFVINGLGNDMGYLRLEGPIEQFAVGGQELWLDDVCPETNCVDFEDLLPAASYAVGDMFVDSGVPVRVLPFTLTGGGTITTGHAVVDNTNMSGGSGLDINTNNVNLLFEFAFPLEGLSFDYGEYGGNVNLTVNGVFTNVLDFADLHGRNLGGVNVVVTGGTVGRVYLFGTIGEFVVGGQELWLDNVCPGTCCVEFESVPPMTSYSVGDSFWDANAYMTLRPFEWSNGTVYTLGTANVSQAGLAGGTGQDMNLNNINMAFDFGVPVSSLSLLFGEYGGNLNLEVNGVFTNFNNFADLDGQVIGGVQISVINGFGNDKGKLTLDGTITSFIVGGQELWIDHICANRFKQMYLPIIMKPEP